MAILYEEGDAIKGDRIRAEARKISKPFVTAKTGRHQAQRITLWENAICVIDKKMRFLPEERERP